MIDANRLVLGASHRLADGGQINTGFAVLIFAVAFSMLFKSGQTLIA